MTLYKCDLCEEIWHHEWDYDDPNDDFTQCPNCGEFEFNEILDNNEILVQQKTSGTPSQQ